jgi:chromosome segregation ATPase
LDEAESNALKGGKKAMNKMETRIRELESELDAENRRLADGMKNLRKSERHIKELAFASDEDRKNHERMQGLIDQLQSRIKSFKKQIEEAEEIAALNLAKYRQAQASMSDAQERADLNEQALAKTKARGRSATPLVSNSPNALHVKCDQILTLKTFEYHFSLLIFKGLKFSTYVVFRFTVNLRNRNSLDYKVI